MSGIFRAGQLVSPVEFEEEGIDLYSLPGGAKAFRGTEDLRVIGRLEKKDLALVVATERTDGGSVYVVGPHGGGWAFGAFLTIVRQPRG